MKETQDTTVGFYPVLLSTTAVNVFGGITSGIAGVLTAHPFDTVRVRLQNATGTNIRWRTLGCTTALLKEDGLLGLYKGVTSPLYGSTAINTLQFALYGAILETFSQLSSWHLPNVFAAGFLAGVGISFVSTPMELAKIQMQITSTGTYASPRECLTRIKALNGWSGAWRGLWMTIVRDAPATGLYFTIFESMTSLYYEQKNRDGQSDYSASASTIIFAGGVSGTLSWLCTYPIDVIKTRYQGIPITEKSSLTIRRWLCEIYQKEGARALFRGFPITAFTAFPVNAVIFYVYATTASWLQSMSKR